MKKLSLLIALLITVFSFAQGVGSVKGKITDKEFNNEPLPYATVLIKGTTTGTSSNEEGIYEFTDLAVGSYTLVFSFVGYETQEIKVDVVADKVTVINVPLGVSAASLGEVLITTTTRKESEAALLLDQKKATEIKQSIGAVELSRKGVGDAAGAVSKISGVSKQEGSSNVYVRGLGDRYLNTTLNGLSLPSNDVNKKNVDLNLFSTDIIENVSISKTYSSRFYGDFSAGNVDISSKDYKGDWFFDFYSGSSVNTNAADQNFLKSEGTSYFGFYNRFDNDPFAVVLSHGFDPVDLNTPININFGGSFGKSFDFENGSRLSFYGTGSFENSFEYRRGSNINFTNVEDRAFDDAEEFEYGTKTTGMVVLNYKLDNHNSFKFNSLFINNSSDRVGNFGIDGGGRNRNAIQNTDEGFFQSNVQFDQNLIYVNQLLGKHNYEKFKIDWGIGYNVVNAHQPDRRRISLENYQLALDNDPNTNPTLFSNVVFDNQRYFQNIKDEELNGRLNFEYDYAENIKLNAGYNGRTKQRDFDNIRFGYDIVNPNTEVTDVNNFDALFSLENLNTSSNPNGLFNIRVINNLPGQSNTNRPGLPENTYNGQLDIHAGYFNAEITADENKWLFAPGIRVESFNQGISFDVINLGNEGQSNRSFSDVVYLPSLSVKYTINDNQNVRFAISETISLPEFKEVAPFVYESVSQRIGGNPDVLGFSRILNIDLKYDWFLSKNEIISIGGFYKRINDPINQVVAFDATGTQRFFRTGDNAQVIGLELELRKNIIMKDEDNAKLSGGFNVTLTDTKQDLFETVDGSIFDVSFSSDEEELQGASPVIINADLSYSPKIGNFEPNANLVFSYFSDRIDALGSGQLGNVIEKGIPTLDFILKSKITEKLEFNFSAKNLLNPTIRYEREGTGVLVTSPNGKDVTDYRRGLNIGFQLKYKF